MRRISIYILALIGTLGLLWKIIFVFDSTPAVINENPIKELILGEHRYYVPIGYAFGRSDVITSAMWALLPDLEPRNTVNDREFGNYGPDSRIIEFRLSLISPKNEKSELDNLIEQKIISPKGLNAPFGLRQYPTLVNSFDYYSGTLSNGSVVVFRCFEEQMPAPVCAAEYKIESDVKIRYSYKRKYLSNWLEIDERLKKLLVSFKEGESK